MKIGNYLCIAIIKPVKLRNNKFPFSYFYKSFANIIYSYKFINKKKICVQSYTHDNRT